MSEPASFVVMRTATYSVVAVDSKANERAIDAWARREFEIDNPDYTAIEVRIKRDGTAPHDQKGWYFRVRVVGGRLFFGEGDG